MILQRLNSFWEDLPDSVRPGYQKALMTKAIQLDSAGKLLGVDVLTGEGSKVRPGKRFEVPREQPQRTSGARARLVHDNGRYVLGLVSDEDKPDRVAKAHQLYMELLDDAIEATGDDDIRAVRTWLSSPTAQQEAKAAGVSPEDDLLIRVDGRIPTDKESVAAFWNLPSGEDAIVARCLVTGEMAEVSKTMPYPIKPIPGGQMSGNMLVSVNFDAARSYGLEGNLNSPISKSAAEAICNALNYLLNHANHYHRVEGTVYVYWVRKRQEIDALRALKEPTPEIVDPLVARRPRKPDSRKAGALIASPKEGLHVGPVDPDEVIVLALTANASRIVVRDYYELTLPKLNENLGVWFEKTDLIGPDGKPARRSKIARLAYSAYRDKKDTPKSTSVKLMDCALNGRPVPQSLLATAVRRNVVEQGPYSTYKGVRRLSYSRLSLIKAVLSDLRPGLDLYKMIEESLQPPAYICGRLLAILDTIQYYALRNPHTKKGPNATVVDRHYGGFSTAPGLTYGQLVSDATKAHLPKIRRSSPGAFAALQLRLEDTLRLLNPLEIPRTLDHEQQGMFALGFYHQKAKDRIDSREARERGEKAPLSDLADNDDLNADEEGESE